MGSMTGAPKISAMNLIEKYEKEMFVRAKIAVQESENAAIYFQNIRNNTVN